MVGQMHRMENAARLAMADFGPDISVAPGTSALGFMVKSAIAAAALVALVFLGTTLF